MQLYAESQLSDDVIGWAVTNIVAAEEEVVLKKTLFYHRWAREMHNLLARLSVSDSLKLVSKDKLIGQREKFARAAIKSILRRDTRTLGGNEAIMQTEEDSKLDRVTQNLKEKVRIERALYQGNAYLGLMLTVSQSEYRDNLESLLQKDFPINLPTILKKELFNRLAELSFKEDTTSQLFKNYLGLSLSAIRLSEALLDEMNASLRKLKPSKKVGGKIVEVLKQHVSQQRLHFSFLFRTKQVNSPLTQTTYRNTLANFKQYGSASTTAFLELLVL